MPPSLSGLIPLAREARSWPFEQARALLERVMRLRLSDPAERREAASLLESGQVDRAVGRFPALASHPVVLQTGYGASGLPHIGTFQEVLRTTMVRNAFRALTDDRLATTLICFSDDMDGLRKVPPAMPNQAMLHADIDKPLTAVRDPFEECDSFGAYNNQRMRAFLDHFGFDYAFRSSTETYRSGAFDPILLRVLERFDEIQAVMLPTLGPDRRATYSPFLPISPRSGKVLQVATLERHLDRGTIVFRDEDGALTELPVTGGAVKLQWKPDWAMRWAALGVDYEMSGKDLIDSVKVSSRVCKILGAEPPEGFSYELFLDEDGAKISKTKGNGLTMEQWLRYGAHESLAYYMFQSPKSAKRLSFDVIPKAADEYLQSLEAYNRNLPVQKGENPEQLNLETLQRAKPSLDNPVWHVHSGAPPDQGSPVSFSLLLNLVSAADASDKAILWGFLSRYLPDTTPDADPLLDRLVTHAIHYYEDFVRPKKEFRLPDPRERAALADLAARLRKLPHDCRDAERVQTEVYEAGKAAGFEPLRAWFQALYEVLLGERQGPRFGSFLAIFGLDRGLALIEQGAAGELYETQGAP